MPEGDSVYVLARRLDRTLGGHDVVRSQLRVPRLADRDLSGRRLLGHDTHGKHLLTRFSGGVTLHSHLLMDGEWSVTRPGKRLPTRLMTEVRLVLEMSTGHTAYGIRLHQLDLVASAEESRLVGHLGPDPLRDDWDHDEAVRRLGAVASRPLVSALLDQTLVAGFGNLWVNELAFLVGVNPWTPVGEVDLDQVLRLGRRALRHSATTPGAFQVTTGLAARGEDHWVSGRQGRPCLRCGTTVRMVEEIPNDPGNRRTWWCPSCQPGDLVRPDGPRPARRAGRAGARPRG